MTETGSWRPVKSGMAWSYISSSASTSEGVVRSIFVNRLASAANLPSGLRCPSGIVAEDSDAKAEADDEYVHREDDSFTDTQYLLSASDGAARTVSELSTGNLLDASSAHSTAVSVDGVSIHAPVTVVIVQSDDTEKLRGRETGASRVACRCSLHSVAAVIFSPPTSSAGGAKTKMRSSVSLEPLTGGSVISPLPIGRIGLREKEFHFPERHCGLSWCLEERRTSLWK